MTRPWTEDQCVLCCRRGHSTKEKKLTKEHIIPEAIGGKLVSKILCKDCNSKLGNYESALKLAPNIHLAIGNLRSDLPELYARMSEGHLFDVQSSAGTATGHYKDGRLAIVEGKASDGSLVYDSRNAVWHLRRMMKKKGVSDEVIDESLERLKRPPTDTPIPLPGELEVISRTAFRIAPRLDATLLTTGLRNNEEVPQGAGVSLVKIAYEFLALTIGSQIFDATFDSARSSLISAEPNPSILRITSSLHKRREYTPHHTIYCKTTSTLSTIKIILFGGMLFTIEFVNPNAKKTGFTVCYKHNLLNGDETWTP